MIIDLALSTGMRVSEISNLKESDLYLGNNEFELIVTRGKGGKRRTVYFDPSLKAHLKKYIIWKHEMGKNRDHMIFSKHAQNMCIESFERVFNKLRDNAIKQKYLLISVSTQRGTHTLQCFMPKHVT